MLASLLQVSSLKSKIDYFQLFLSIQLVGETSARFLPNLINLAYNSYKLKTLENTPQLIPEKRFFSSGFETDFGKNNLVVF